MNNNLHTKILENYIINIKKIIDKFNENKFNEFSPYYEYNDEKIFFEEKLKKIKNDIIYKYLIKKYTKNKYIKNKYILNPKHYHGS